VTIEDLHIDAYTDRDGASKPKLAGNIIAITFVPMPKQEGAAPAPRPAPAPAPRPAPAKTGFDDMDSDEIPF